jgi:hypothetical protein
MNSLSHSVLKAVLCVMPVTLPIELQNENLFQSEGHPGDRTSTRLLTRNSLNMGTFVIHQAHRGW